MKKLLVLSLVAVLSLGLISVVASADIFTPGAEYGIGLGGPDGLPNWMDIAETGPAGLGIM